MDDKFLVMEGSSVENNIKQSFIEVKFYNTDFKQRLIYVK
jgi:hypothetical protein